MTAFPRGAWERVGLWALPQKNNQKKEDVRCLRDVCWDACSRVCL